MGEFWDGFAAEGGAFFFIFVDIELLHGGRGDVFALIFGAVLEEHIGFDAETAMHHGGEDFFDQVCHELGLGLHLTTTI